LENGIRDVKKEISLSGILRWMSDAKAVYAGDSLMVSANLFTVKYKSNLTAKYSANEF
jgi:hypothetical protein